MQKQRLFGITGVLGVQHCTNRTVSQDVQQSTIYIVLQYIVNNILYCFVLTIQYIVLVRRDNTIYCIGCPDNTIYCIGSNHNTNILYWRKRVLQYIVLQVTRIAIY